MHLSSNSVTIVHATSQASLSGGVMVVPVHERVCIRQRSCVAGVSKEALGLMLSWLRLRQSSPLGVSMIYNQGAFADVAVILAVCLPAVLTQASVSLGISGSSRT